MKKKGMGLDNRGATLVFSIVTIMFITILASLILSLAVSNFKVKSVDYKTRQDFYSAEVAANEIYSGLGTYAVEYLGQAYTQALSQMEVTVTDANNYILYDNGAELNKIFRKEYMSRLVAYVLNDASAYTAASVKNRIFSDDASVVSAFNDEINNSATYDIAKLKYVLEKCITGNKDNTKIEILTLQDESGNDLPKLIFEEAVSGEPTFTINNVKITYNNGTNISEETFDIRLKFPDWSLYVERKPLGNPYIHYALIGEEGVVFDSGTVNSVTGGVYGGGTQKGPNTDSTGGVQILNTEVTITPQVTGSIKGALVSAGDIVVESSVTKNAQLNVSGGKTWCTNIVIPAGRTLNEVDGAGINFDAAAKAFVKDDLEISGDKSNVVINGDYCGYGINITESSAGNVNSAASSSAIIVNGSKANVSINPAGKLYVAGRAYINIGMDGIVDYVTGESVALKGNQQAYLVPGAWMAAGKTNPCPDAVYSPYSSNVAALVDTSKVPAALSSLLDPTAPFVAKRARSGGIYWFIYFNFKDSDSAVTFIRNAAAGAYDANGATIAATINSNDDTVLETVNVGVATGNAVTSGAVSASNGSTVSISGNYRATEITMTTYNNYNNRYQLMSHLLVAADNDDDIIYDKRNVNGTSYDLSCFTLKVTDNYIDRSVLTSGSYSNVDETVSVDGTSCRIIYKDNAGSDPYKYNDNSATPVIIVCTGDVNIENSFSGLVVAFGNIEISKGATITAAPVIVDKILTSASLSTGVRAGEVFRYYQSTTGNIENMDAVQYSDVIRYENWRKG